MVDEIDDLQNLKEYHLLILSSNIRNAIAKGMPEFEVADDLGIFSEKELAVVTSFIKSWKSIHRLIKEDVIKTSSIEELNALVSREILLQVGFDHELWNKS